MTYLPPDFAEHDRDNVLRFLDAHPFGTVITTLDGQLWPTPLPLIHRPGAAPTSPAPASSAPTSPAPTSPTPTSDHWGSFICHVAKANPMWQADPGEVLVAINGPQTYISPTWYPSKAEHHRTVPTWNYATVHAWGAMTVHHDPTFKRMAVGLLTKIHERTSTDPWSMADAPRDFIDEQLDHIVGIEIWISRLVAKFRLNQNRTAADRAGVIAGLADRDRPGDAAVRSMMLDRDPRPDAP